MTTHVRPVLMRLCPGITQELARNLPWPPARTPRPQACTADYRPVCGQLTNGEKKTYGNACSACGDAAVIGSFPGECP